MIESSPQLCSSFSIVMFLFCVWSQRFHKDLWSHFYLVWQLLTSLQKKYENTQRVPRNENMFVLISELWEALKWISLSTCWTDFSLLCGGHFQEKDLIYSTGIPFSLSLAEDFYWLGTTGINVLELSHLVSLSKKVPIFSL